jgi:hypothetical protein
MKKLVALLLVVPLLYLSACRSDRPTQVRDTTINTVNNDSLVTAANDSLIGVAPDSSLLKAFLAVDSNGQVVMKELEEYKHGKNVNVPTVNIKNNHLIAKCDVDSFAVWAKYNRYFQYQANYKKQEGETIITQTEYVQYIPWFKKFLIKCGWAFWVLIILLGIYKYLKSQFTIPKINFSFLKNKR